MECGCPFCRFWICTRRVEGKSARKDRRTPKASPISRRVRTSRQRHGVRLSVLPLLDLHLAAAGKAPEKTGDSKSFANIEARANLAPASRLSVLPLLVL